jgi:hypothetical protein
VNPASIGLPKLCWSLGATTACIAKPFIVSTQTMAIFAHNFGLANDCGDWRRVVEQKSDARNPEHHQADRDDALAELHKLDRTCRHRAMIKALNQEQIQEQCGAETQRHTGNMQDEKYCLIGK